MKPFLFNIGDLQVSSFFFMIMVATLASTFYASFAGGRSGLRREIFLDMGMIGMAAGVLGARIFHILVEAPDYYLEHPLYVFHFWRGGFVSFGAFVAVPVALYLYVRMRKLEVWRYLDVLAISTPIIQFFIRVACLLTGCCYGKPTDLPWAITFTHPASTAHYFFPGVPLHPTQIYSGIHAVVLFVAINLFYWKKKKFAGQTAWLVLMGYLVPRGIIEFFRGDADRGVWLWGIFSTGQIVGIVGVAMAIYMYRRLKKSEM